MSRMESPLNIPKSRIPVPESPFLASARPLLSERLFFDQVKDEGRDDGRDEVSSEGMEIPPPRVPVPSVTELDIPSLPSPKEIQKRDAVKLKHPPPPPVEKVIEKKTVRKGGVRQSSSLKESKSEDNLLTLTPQQNLVPAFSPLNKVKSVSTGKIVSTPPLRTPKRVNKVDKVKKKSQISPLPDPPSTNLNSSDKSDVKNVVGKSGPLPSTSSVRQKRKGKVVDGPVNTPSTSRTKNPNSTNKLGKESSDVEKKSSHSPGRKSPRNPAPSLPPPEETTTPLVNDTNLKEPTKKESKKEVGSKKKEASQVGGVVDGGSHSHHPEDGERDKVVRELSQRVLLLCQKSDWHGVDQTLRHLEKLELPESLKPLQAVADEVDFPNRIK